MKSMDKNLGELLIRPMRNEDIPYVRKIDQLSFSMPWPIGAYEYELKADNHQDASIRKDKNQENEPGKPGRSNQWVAVLHPASPQAIAQPKIGHTLINDPTALKEQQGKIIGMVVVWYIIDEVHIATLAVHPDYRRQGVANRLIVTVLQKALYHGFKTVTLEVRAGNLAAQALYRKFGFEIVGKRPHYYKDNQEDAYIMTLNEIGTPYESWLSTIGWNDQPTLQEST
jgi:[ribosomal protein S18]-alanine N-acetyltransferase